MASVDSVDDWEEVDSPGDCADESLLHDFQNYHIVDLPSCSSEQPVDTTDLSREIKSESPLVELSPCDDKHQDLLTAVPKDHRQQLPLVAPGLKAGRLSESCYSPACCDKSAELCHPYFCRQKLACQPSKSELHPSASVRDKFLHKIIASERQYTEILDFVDTDIVKALYFVKPPIVSATDLSDLMQASFSNILAMRRWHRSLLGGLSDRCYAVGDLLLDLVEGLRPAYLDYLTKLPTARRMLRRQRKSNAAFSLFSYLISERLLLRAQSSGCPRDMDNLLDFPIRHLQKLEIMLDDLLLLTPQEHPDVFHLTEALELISILLSASPF